MESNFINKILNSIAKYENKVAVVDQNGKRKTTYGEIYGIARQTVAYLKKQNIAPGSFVAIKIAAGAEYLAVELGIWLSHCAVVPMGDVFPQARVDYIMGHCESPLLIDDAAMQEILKTIPVDGEIPDAEENALLIYTSGSTGNPKGVLMDFDSLGWASPHTVDKSAFTSVDVIGYLGPFYFIAVACVYDVLIAGGETHFFSSEVRSNPKLLENYIADHGITVCYIPPAMLPVFHNHSKKLRSIVALGEKLEHQCSRDGFVLYNLYGMTEAAGSIALYEVPETMVDEVPVGRPKHDIECRIVDEEGNEVPQGEIGELCLKGHFSKGYYKDLEQTAELFKDGWLHTSDLFRQDENGLLYYVNRKDWMVKINGLRVEPGEVEKAMKKVDGVVNAVAKGFDNGEGSQFLCGYYISETWTPEALKQKLTELLPAYMVPSFLVKVDKFALNASGKVDRKMLLRPDVSLLSEKYEAPANYIEKQLCDAFATVCGLTRVGANDDFFMIGGNSVRVMKVQVLCPQFPLSSRMIFKCRTPRGIARELQMTEGQQDRKTLDEVPLTQTQLGIYLECVKHDGEALYNNPFLYRIKGSLDLDRLAKALEQAVAAHPAISAQIVLGEDGYPMMRRQQQPSSEQVCTIEKMSEAELELLKPQLQQPFLIGTDRLFRIRLIETEKAQYIFTDFHHIIFDGTSMHIFLDDVDRAYRGESVDPESFTGFDVAQMESEERKTDFYIQAKDWYLKTFEEVDHASLPSPDKKEDAVSYGNYSQLLTVKPEEIETFCQLNGITANVLTTGAFGYLLSVYTREKSPAFVTIYNGRQNIQTSRTMSMMVKTFPVSCPINVADTVGSYLLAMKQQMMGAMANDIYSFAEFVAATGMSSDVMFTYQGEMFQASTIDGVQLEDIGLAFNATGEAFDAQVLAVPDGLQLDIQYHSDKFSEDFIRRFAKAYNMTLKALLSKHYLSEIQIIDNDDLAELIKVSCGDKLEYDATKTFPEKFSLQAGQHPDSIAVVDKNSSITYGELDRVSNALAIRLRELGIGSPEVESPFVCVMLGCQKEFIVSVLGAQKAGGAYIPLDYDYPSDRLSYMLEDSESQVLITSHEVYEEKTANGGTFNAKNILFIDDFINEIGDKVFPQTDYSTLDGLAYMIYTSGSTGKPKGVMIPHKAKIAFLSYIVKEMKLTDKSRILCHSSFSFDASVEDLFSVLTIGGRLYIVPEEARKDMDLLYKFIVDNGVTGCEFSTQVGLMLLQMYPDVPLEYCNVGGEKMTCNPKCKCHLINTYGPTEFTVDATLYHLEPGREYRNIPIGRPLDNQAGYVIDRYGHLVPKGVAGELCLAGIQMAAGYWRRNELTNERFSNIVIGNKPVKVYHTGDLVRYNDENQLEYFGRIDSQVKLRGFRIELGEIESLIARYDGIHMVSVQVKEIAGAQHLCAYYSANCKIDSIALKAYLAEQLTAYMVPTSYMQLDQMPLTPNGKVNTRALPNPEIEVDERVEPETDTERKLFEVTAELLNYDKFGVTTNLISIGLTSLLAMRLSAAIQQKTNRTIPTKDILMQPTLRQLALIADGTSATTQQLAAHEKQEFYPLTENQRGVYVDWEMNRNTTQYNIPVVKTFRSVNARQLKDAIVIAVNAHPYLKLKMLVRDGDIMQQRRDNAPVNVKLITLDSELTPEELQMQVRPFNLLGDELYRFIIFESPKSVILFMDIHHIIFDGISDNVLMKDIEKAYRGEVLTPENYTAFDFALDDISLKDNAIYAEAEKHIDSIIGDGEACVYPHSVKTDTTSAGSAFCTLKVNAAEINDYCRKKGLTTNNYFMTAFMQVLHRVTRDENVVITTVNNGRNHLETQDIVGMFVKTLVVSSVCDASTMKQQSFADVALNLQKQFQKTQGFDFYPFTTISERHQLRAEIMFVYEGGLTPLDENGFVAREEYLTLNTVKIPLTLYVIPDNDNYLLRADYDTSMYSTEDMQQLLSMLNLFCQKATSAATLAEIPVLDETGITAVMKVAAGKRLDVDLTQTFASLFVAQAQRTPDALAVAGADSEYTYRQLNQYSDTYAHILMENGVKPDMFVCVMLDRTKEFPLTVLAIHKVGAAYTPLDLEYPNERLSYMIADSESTVMITTHTILQQKMDEGNLNVGNIKILYLDDIDLSQETAPVNLSTPENLAYMIYTSGSTGKPKGVVLHQKGLRSYIASMVDVLQITSEDHISNHRPFSFDAHIQDLYPALTVGGSIHIMPSVIRKDMTGLRDFIVSHQITGGSYTTSLGAMLLESYQLPLRYMTLTGEKMMGLVSRDVQLVNGYGPTECTDLISTYLLEKERIYQDIPIGRPMANSYCFIIDWTGNLLPLGTAGELCFASVQVGCGYWKLPEKTKEVFEDCPFLPNDENGQPVRMYHTGDLCRWNAEGNLEYLGRIDNQVKLRGFRIELGEIESKALNINGVQQAVAIVKKINGSDHLVLYHTLKDGFDLTGEQMRKAMESTSLAEYMIPDVYMRLDEFPLSPSGKINRKVLPVPVIEAENVVAPQTEMEKDIFEMIALVLNHRQFGVTSNLVSMGLTSLGAMKAGLLLTNRYNVHLNLPEVMQNPTILNIIQLIEKAKTANENNEFAVNTENKTVVGNTEKKKINLFAKKK